MSNGFNHKVTKTKLLKVSRIKQVNYSMCKKVRKVPGFYGFNLEKNPLSVIEISHLTLEIINSTSLAVRCITSTFAKYFGTPRFLLCSKRFFTPTKRPSVD